MCKSVLTLAFLSIVLYPLFAQDNGYNYSEEEKLYKSIANIELNTLEGRRKFSEIYDKSPVILAMIFTKCTGVCSPFMSTLSKSIKKLNSKENFKILVVSFDPTDSIADMKTYAEAFRLDKDAHWIFATTPDIDSLNSSIGFNPKWDEEKKQFDHDALLVGINGNGYIVKKLTGVRGPDELQLMIKEINNGFVLSYPLPRENMLFSCFTYDPKTGTKKPSLGLLILVLPVVMAVLIVGGLAFFRRK